MNTSTQSKLKKARDMGVSPGYLRPKRRAFFFHFNKPLSRQRGRPQITVHYKQACYVVDNVVCGVPTKGRISKRQPFFVMAGKGGLMLWNNIAYIT